MGGQLLTEASGPPVRGGRFGWLGLIGPAASRAVLCVLFTFGVCGFVVPVVSGLEAVTITSGSMAPTLPVGAVVLVDPSRDPAPGRVVTFRRRDRDDGALVTHRVSRAVDEGWRTKGDANGSEDTWTVADQDVVGVGRVVVPLIGLPRVWMDRGDNVRLLAAAVGFAALVWSASKLTAVGRREPSRIATSVGLTLDDPVAEADHSAIPTYVEQAAAHVRAVSGPTVVLRRVPVPTRGPAPTRPRATMVVRRPAAEARRARPTVVVRPAAARALDDGPPRHVATVIDLRPVTGPPPAPAQRGRAAGVRVRLVSAAAVALLLFAPVPSSHESAAAFLTSTGNPGNSFGARTVPAPTNITATPGCGLLVIGPKVDLTWTAVTGADSYRIFRRTGTNPFTLRATVTGTTHSDTGLSAFTTYDYRIRTVHSTFVSVDSATKSATTGFCS